MKYVDFATLTSSGGVANAAGAPSTFILNSTFAPGGSTAHQPYLRDQFAGTLYNRYKVHSVRLDFTIFAYGPAGTSTQVQQQALLWIVTAPGTTYSLVNKTLQDVIEKPGGGYRLTSAAPQKLTLKYDFAQIAGITKQQFNANVEDFAADYGSSPSKQFTLQVSAAGPFATSQSVGYILEMYQVVEWYDRALPSAS